MALEGVKSEKSEENNGNVPDGKANGIDNKSKQIDPNTAFLRAARGGQLDTVVDLLDSSAVKDINTCNSNGLNALHLAAKDGHIAVVEELIKRGATVDAATKKGNTALHIACLAGQEAVARALLGAGAKADAQSAAGFTPLYMAAQENHAGCVKMLLAAGANQTLATEDGFTPLAVAMQQGHDRVVAELLESDTRGKVRLPALHIAAKKNDVKAATLLLENEHNPDACSKSGFTPLHIAAHYGNVGVAKCLLSSGADPGRAAKHNITPLHVASKWGQLAMVDLLVENGANIAAMTRDGLTPLHCAARSGHSNVVSRLLQHGAPITSKTKNGLTPLHMSVQGEHVETAKVLLSEGAPIDDVTVDYLTALHVAAHCGHVKVAKLLLDRNADANARALNGFTPLHIACKKNRLKVVELLLKYGASKSATTESGLTPLHVASFMGCMNIALVLVGAGADADAATARGETPLHLAARAHQTDLVRVLLRNNAKVEARAREDQTALHVSARLGHGDVAALLLQHGASVAAATKDRYTPLHIAAKEGKEEVASILLDHNAPIEAETRKGFTPLHLAAKYGDIGVARLLLARGAQPDAPGKSHITPLHMATYYGHPDIALLLLDKGASPHSLAKNGHSALHIACRHNHPDIAFALLEHDADPGVKSKAGFTPLHMAAQEGHEDCVEMLIERGADVNVPANNGLTPVHLAAAEGRTGVLRALLGAGGRCGARTRDGYTPLHAAAHHAHVAAARALLDAGADVSARAAHGFTPLHQAAQQGHTLIIQLLLKSNADPNALSASGQTACALADRLGYISAVEALRPLTENTLSQAVGDGGLEGKYRVAAPELMQDTFMSDSEDEGGEVECPIQQQQQYRYMNSEAGTLNRARPLEDSVTDGHLWPSNNDSRVATIERQPLDIGFLVSFVVDARGGAMKAKRRGGVRIIVPPAACAAPTRVTCRAATRRAAAAAAPPPLMEGEALASRLLELQPQGAKFLAPVIIEVPIFTASCPEREIVILRSDTGETWQDHYLHNNDNPMIQDTLAREREEHGNSGESLGENGERVTRIITCDFPHYLAVVSRVRQEVHIIGPEGGTISSAHIPQVQALFPAQALTKRIRVGVQAHGADAALRTRMLPRLAAVSPVITVEPRRRKFHRSITLTAPLPQHRDPKLGHDKQGTANLRLLCSIMGGQARAVWEDVTGSTPLTITDDCASFTTTVSARFWLMNCQNVSDATKLATELYREMLLVPFEVRIVVLGKRLDALEGRLLVLYITDRYAYDTLLHQEHYTEVAHSTAVRFLDGKPIYLEFSGNLVPVTKSGTQPTFTFEAFKDNRVEFTVRVKHNEENPSGRIYFMNEPKAAKGEQAASPACVLDVALPERIAPRAAKSHLDCLNLDQSGFDALKDELSFHWGDHNHSIGPPPIPQEPGLQLNGHDKTIANGDVKYPTKETEEDKDGKPTVFSPNYAAALED
ncbi:ankyrin-3-like isoform X2 [Vanessa cardui]|uniref:ankyrin-3-like isoform X2 n=1 Tax=Vanessa cardui TaxID=171605 RepID=UPI001F12B128|nr:ankyrin-3-like isoform X2 [Vanessa cardui]